MSNWKYKLKIGIITLLIMMVILGCAWLIALTPPIFIVALIGITVFCAIFCAIYSHVKDYFEKKKRRNNINFY